MSQKFIEVPVTKSSIAQRSLVCGMGINDSPYKTVIATNPQIICKFYVKWRHMLIRCYSKKYQKK